MPWRCAERRRIVAAAHMGRSTLGTSVCAAAERLPRTIVFQPRPIWRVHQRRYRPAQAHATAEDDACFSPIYRDSTPVPVLYGATHLPAALRTTVFHDLPQTRSGYILDIATTLRGQQLCVSCIQPQHPLQLLDVTNAGLLHLGLSREQLMDAPVLEYQRSRARVSHWYADSSAQGLLWDVRNDHDELPGGAAQGVLLFGDRVTEADFAVQVNRMPLDKEPALQAVLVMVQRLGIGVFGI